jgi:hypothetical protein
MYFPIMAEYAVQRLQAQIPPFSLPFNPIQELDTLNVMLKKTDPMLLAKIGKHSLPIVPERGVADIVPQSNRLDEIFIQSQEPPDGPGNF